MINISVLKFAEIGAFDGKISMSVNLGKKGLFCIENLQNSEERGLILPHPILCKAHIPLEIASASANFRVANAENDAQTT